MGGFLVLCGFCVFAGGLIFAAWQWFGNPLNGAAFAGGFVGVKEDAVKRNSFLGDGKALGLVGEEALDDGLHFASQDAFLSAGKSGIAKKAGAAGKDLLIGGLNMSVRADQSGNASVKESRHGDFLRGGFGVHVDEDDGSFPSEKRKGGVDGVKGVVQCGHERASLKIDHRHRAAAGMPPYGCSLAGSARWIVERTEKSGFFLQQLHHRSLIPKVIARSDDVHLRLINLVGCFRSNAGASGGVFSIGDDHVDVALPAKERNEFPNGPPSRRADDVADKKNSHLQETIRNHSNDKEEAARGFAG